MLRTLWVILVALVATIFCGTAVMVVALVRSTSPLIDRFIRLWARSIVRAAGICLSVEHEERIDPGKRYIIVANHYSYLDIPCVLAGVTQPVRFLAKVSLFKIPIFGWAIRAAGFIPIDRKNRKTAVRSFDLAAERIRKGNTIVVFPEEGRTRTRELRPFQRGAFLLALRSELPLLPIAIDGTYAVLPVGGTAVRPGPVVLRVTEPIETSGLSVRGREELSALVRKTIERELKIEN